MRRLRTVGIVLVVLAIVAGGCASEQSVAPSRDSWEGDDEGEAGYLPGMAPTEEAEADYAEEEAPAAPNAGGDGADIERMVVRNGSMEVVVDDVMDATQELAAIAATFGGHVVSSSVYEDNGRTFGSVAIRVDSATGVGPGVMRYFFFIYTSSKLLFSSPVWIRPGSFLFSRFSGRGLFGRLFQPGAGF